MSKVQDVVRDRQLFYVEEGKSVADVARRMTDLHVGAILVLKDGKLRGVFSERDLMKRVVAEGRDPRATLVDEVMSRDVVTVDECASLEEAMELMQAHSCRHLPVTSGSQVTAFLSMRDLMNDELARKTEELRHMQAYIHGSM